MIEYNGKISICLEHEGYEESSAHLLVAFSEVFFIDHDAVLVLDRTRARLFCVCARYLGGYKMNT